MAAKNPWLILTVVSSGLFLVGVDMTVLNVALPRLALELGATTSEKLWMVNAYSLVMAGLLPGFGTLSDKVGHRTILIIGLVVFGLSSGLAAFSPSPMVLIAARGLLAIGAAMIMPATISIVRIVFTENHQRAVAIGIWTSVWAGAAALGPILGGLLLDHFWWGSVFLINLPVVLVTLTLTLTRIPHLPGNRAQYWDLPTSLLLTVALVALLYAIKASLKAEAHWGEAAIAVVTGFAFMWLFLVRQRTLPSPLIDFSLFRNPRFSLGATAAFFACFVLLGLQYVLSQELQLVRSFTPLQTGMFVLPLAAGSFVAGPIIGGLIFKIGVERLMTAALSLSAFGMGLYALIGSHASVGWEVVAFGVIGFGLGAVMSIASTAIMVNAPDERAGMAGSVESIAYGLGGTLGVAIMGSIIASIYAWSFQPPAAAELQPVAWDSLDQTLIAAMELPGDVAQQVLNAGKAAFMEGASACFAAATVLLVTLFALMAIRVLMADRSSITK